MARDTSAKRNSRAHRIWREYVRPLFFMLMVLWAFRTTVADWNDVPTGSMKPSIIEGDRIVVNKLAYDLKLPFAGWQVMDWGSPRAGDVIVFWAPDTGIRLVKRVVGVPGDRIEMRANVLYVNDRALDYGPLDPAVSLQVQEYERRTAKFGSERLGLVTHPVMLTPGKLSMDSFGPVTVKTGTVFVMGDNRDNSKDSRYFGAVPRKLILGKAVGVAFSLDYDHHSLPRWGRWFRALP